MKYFIATIAVSVLTWAPTTGFAMALSGETPTKSPVYKPTKSAVEKTMKNLGYDISYDEDGDIEFTTKNGEWHSYIIFDKLDNGKIWNLQALTKFQTDEKKYDELLDYINTRNAEYKYPKLSLSSKSSLRATINYPVEFGFNPDEFEENVILMLENTLATITDEADEMLK